MAKKPTSKKSPGRQRRSGGGGRRSAPGRHADPSGKHLVIVESPTKAKTINRYLGDDYVVMASVGHVRDLPKSAPKGAKRKDHPVPGVDLEREFEPTYDILPDKKKTVGELKKAAKKAADVWFATDLDREGEAIAWHLAHALDYPVDQAKRVVFNAITKDEIEHAFSNPRSIDDARVNAQQARRILDRIVGYQVSPLLWKKVAGGLSAGRVQSVAVRLVVERERQIEAFIPDEFWKITALFSADPDKAGSLAERWLRWAKVGDEENPRSQKDQNAWLSEHDAIRAELVEIDGENRQITNRDEALDLAKALGFEVTETREWQDPKGKGPARFRCEYVGRVADDAPPFTIEKIETKRSRSRPSAPFITSTMQQVASTRLGFQLKRTMRVAQQLYEGVDLGGARGQTGLITYMRTDSTHLSRDAIDMARGYVGKQFGDRYLPDKPQVYSSSNKSAQEAHEAIRPTDVNLTPDSIRGKLNDEQFKLYDLIWRRFVACQMSPAEVDSTSVLIGVEGRLDGKARSARFRAGGRRIVFDGFYRVMGVPNADVILPELREKQRVGLVHVEPTQHFTSPPPRYTEASLQKKLEEEGIGRPSTYAPIISTIQDRKYVEPVAPRDKRLRATDLGKVVTDMLVEAFPKVMDVSYTRYMEDELDKIEDERHDWRQMLKEFYEPFRQKLDKAHDELQHAKAATEPAPYDCATCGAPTVYRFGKNGRFLSCSRYPDCKYAAPVDADGKPLEPQLTDILCPEDGSRMIRRDGRFGPFLSSVNYPDVKFVLKLDPKKGTVVLPKVPPLLTDITCPKCEDAKLYMRESKRGYWLSCSNFPKCRGRLAWSKLDEEKQKQLEAAWKKHEAENPAPIVRTIDGRIVGEDYVPQTFDSAADRGADSGEWSTQVDSDAA